MTTGILKTKPLLLLFRSKTFLYFLFVTKFQLATKKHVQNLYQSRHFIYSHGNPTFIKSRKKRIKGVTHERRWSKRKIINISRRMIVHARKVVGLSILWKNETNEQPSVVCVWCIERYFYICVSGCKSVTYLQVYSYISPTTNQDESEVWDQIVIYS